MKNTVTAAVLRDLDTGFQIKFNKALGNAPDFMGKLCMEIISTTAEEAYGWMAALPSLAKKAGEAIKHRLQILGQSVRNEEFEGIIEVPRTAIEDDKYGVFGSVAAMWGDRAALAPALEFIEWLKLSFTTSLAYTGQSFFHTAHKAHAKATVFSNKGTKKLSAANFQIAYASLRGRKDAAGVPLFTLRDTSKVFLIVCEDDESTADSIVKLAKLEAGGDNPNFNKAQPLVLPGLQPAGANRPWFLVDCSGTIKPFVFQNRLNTELTKQFNPDSDTVFNLGLYSWKARRRFAIAGGLPELAYGSTGADAA